MNIPPLCIIQARLNSTRLPQKMLLDFGGETLIARAWRIACEAFGTEHCVIAMPAPGPHDPLLLEIERFGGAVFGYDGDENDVLGRFWTCAHRYRWHPDSVIVRYTPDDPWKEPQWLRRVAAGERLPVEMGGEAFTLAMLDAAHARTAHSLPVSQNMLVAAVTGKLRRQENPQREHITHALFPTLPPKPTLGPWTIDTQQDYEAALAVLNAQT